jgi:RNA recognition motif-containing protein
MGRGTYSQGKQQRESDKARKKRDKAARRERRREREPEAFEITSVEEIIGNIPTTNEAMAAMEKRAKTPRAAAAIPCRLFVGSLSWDTTEAGLRELFSQFGTVTDVVIPVDHGTNRSRGFGFVTFENRKDGAQAVEQLDGYELDGGRIVVNVATSR